LLLNYQVELENNAEKDGIIISIRLLKNVLEQIVKNGYCIFIIKKKVTNGLISHKIFLEELTMLLKIIGTQV
jgi:hypothetical protein